MTAKGSMDWIKAAGDPSHFYSMPDVDKFFQRANSSFAWMGHNRAGTIGKNSNDNAHPFEHDNILGVHNGTIRNKYEITKDGHKFEVDSDAFFNGVKLNGIKETVKKTEGAFSVVYFDSKDGSINFARNDQRPMQFLTCVEKAANATMEDRKFIFFGSELGLLWWVCSRNGFICGDHITSTVLQHYKFFPGEEKPIVAPLEAHVPKWSGTGTIHIPAGTRTDWTAPKSKIHQKKEKQDKPALLLAQSTGASNMDSTVPLELRKIKWMNDPDVSGQDKKTLERIFREAIKNRTINFKADDLIDLGTCYQIIGSLAGRKKQGLPVIISTMVDKEWIGKHSDSAIFNATVTHRQFTPDLQTIEIIVRDPHEIFNNVKEAALNA